MQLRIDGGMPLSWKEEGPMGKGGYRAKSISVGRRVWGALIGRALYAIESVDDGAALALIDMRDGSRGRIIQKWPREAGYDSPWGGEGHSRLVQVAQWHEEQAFNAQLDLIEWDSKNLDSLPMPTEVTQ